MNIDKPAEGLERARLEIKMQRGPDGALWVNKASERTCGFVLVGKPEEVILELEDMVLKRSLTIQVFVWQPFSLGGVPGLFVLGNVSAPREIEDRGRSYENRGRPKYGKSYRIYSKR